MLVKLLKLNLELIFDFFNFLGLSKYYLFILSILNLKLLNLFILALFYFNIIILL
jgi:hypothetical protein